jgi:HNH endonuclease
MTKKRKSIPIEVRKLVLHESGYKCANPACRSILTLDIHHLDYVSEGGSDNADNLLPLCPNCHSLHHQDHIPIESLRAWKMLLLSLNEGFDRKSIDVLLALDKLGWVFVSGDGALDCAVLIASGLVEHKVHNPGGNMRFIYEISLSEKGRFLVDAWKQGNQEAVVTRGGIDNTDGV